TGRERVLEKLGELPEAILRFIHEITNVDKTREDFHFFLQHTLDQFKTSDREPASQPGTIRFIYLFRRLSRQWEQESGGGKYIKELWRRYHQQEVQTVYGTSTRDVIGPGPDGESIDSLSMRMVRIPPGSFLMGDDEDSPIHRVHISKPFLMAAVPVTNTLYSQVMGKVPSHFKGENRPVESVSWFEAVEFCNRLSEKEGLK
ncbi:MAG: SUMF1/EgtB/PvdO family nonheme iron enzyme, partial [bacterium]|nr:SUMF1/EgtB/PvdO family nonheme iron enzyme [bacterium]